MWVEIYVFCFDQKSYLHCGIYTLSLYLLKYYAHTRVSIHVHTRVHVLSHTYLSCMNTQAYTHMYIERSLCINYKILIIKYYKI